MSNVSSEILSSIITLSEEKEVNSEIVFQAIEGAFSKVAGEYYGVDVVAKINHGSGDIVLFQRRLIAEESSDKNEISLKSALQADSNATIGTYLLTKLPPMPLQRMSAMAIRNIVTERIHEAEKEKEYQEYIKRQGEIISGFVKKVTPATMIVGVGNKSEAIIFRNGLIKTDNYPVGSKIKAYVERVERNKECQIILSRTHPDFLSKLMEAEVSEIYEGSIEIIACVREPGSKSKVAVRAADPRLDAVGACIGPKGSRIRPVSDELRGEKIDIVYWDRDISQFVKNAIVPAKVISVTYYDESGSAKVVIPDEDLKYGIGTRGQNVRLASKLTGVNITVVSESQEKEVVKEKTQNAINLMSSSLDLDESLAQFIVSIGIMSPEDLLNAGITKLTTTGVFTEEIAEELLSRARQYAAKVKQEREQLIAELSIPTNVLSLEGMSDEIAITLSQNNIKTLEDIADLSTDELSEILGINSHVVTSIIMDARKIAYGI